MPYQKVRDGVFWHQKKGRLVEHHGYSTRIFWSTQMLDYLRAHFATTINRELAELLEVSERTLVRKARELGLKKDPEWMAGISGERRMMAQAAAKRKGNPGAFKKGSIIGKEYRFKPGHKMNPEWEKKRLAGMRRWYRLHPDKVRERNRKVTEIREARRRASAKVPQENISNN